MTGKKGMNTGNMGGTRKGAGAPYKFAPKKGEVFIMERSSLNGEHDEIKELWLTLGVSGTGNTLEFQHGNTIITIRRPEADDLRFRDA